MSRLEFFDVIGQFATRPACEYKKNTKEGEEEKLSCNLRLKKKRKIFSTVKVHYFYIVGKTFPIMIMTEGLNFTSIPADKFQKNVRIVFMRVILSRCVIVDVWLKRSFYTTGCEKHIATFAIRLIKHFSSTGKHVFIPSDKMWQIRHFQYIKIQNMAPRLGGQTKEITS